MLMRCIIKTCREVHYTRWLENLQHVWEKCHTHNPEKKKKNQNWGQQKSGLCTHQVNGQLEGKIHARLLWPQLRVHYTRCEWLWSRKWCDPGSSGSFIYYRPNFRETLTRDFCKMLMKPAAHSWNGLFIALSFLSTKHDYSSHRNLIYRRVETVFP